MSDRVYTVIGLMSGTSLDGVDVAILTTDGARILGYGPHMSCSYSAEEQAILKTSMQDALSWNFQGPQPNSFARAEGLIHEAHIRAVTQLLADNNLSSVDIDLIGFHGQTVLHHAPSQHAKGRTLQLGDGQVLAQALGIDTVYDFRSADVDAGGQGAPLSPIYHQALVANTDAVTAVLNIGGVSNITVMRPHAPMVASDCGPGNGPLDQWVEQHGLGAFDEGGKLSLKGTPDFERIARWMERGFFKLPLPKSADRYDFDVLAEMAGMSAHDGAATLCAFCALSVAQSVDGLFIDRLIVCGGGRHNPAIMAALREALGCTVLSSEHMGWEGDALEAQAFAYMAVRSVLGLPISFPQTTGVPSPISGGLLVKAKL